MRTTLSPSPGDSAGEQISSESTTQHHGNGLSGATETVPVSVDMDDGIFDAVIGGVIAAVILVLLCLAVVVVRYMYRHKGTYRTNEAKGTEFAETADNALRSDPSLQDAVDESKKEYFI